MKTKYHFTALSVALSCCDRLGSHCCAFPHKCSRVRFKERRGVSVRRSAAHFSIFRPQIKQQVWTLMRCWHCGAAHISCWKDAPKRSSSRAKKGEIWRELSGFIFTRGIYRNLIYPVFLMTEFCQKHPWPHMTSHWCFILSASNNQAHCQLPLCLKRL